MHQSTPGAFEKNGQFYKNVEDVRAKDLVLSWNEKTGEFEYKPVVETYIRQADKIYQLTYEDGTLIETTWSHPFYIEGKGWVKAEDLKPGDVSKASEGSLKIVKVHVDPRSEEVYNFQVFKNHTYTVTETGVVVHNAPEDEYDILNLTPEQYHEIMMNDPAPEGVAYRECQGAGDVEACRAKVIHREEMRRRKNAIYAQAVVGSVPGVVLGGQHLVPG